MADHEITSVIMRQGLGKPVSDNKTLEHKTDRFIVYDRDVTQHRRIHFNIWVGYVLWSNDDGVVVGWYFKILPTAGNA